jgi:hypothetical protein
VRFDSAPLVEAIEQARAGYLAGRRDSAR